MDRHHQYSNPAIQQPTNQIKYPASSSPKVKCEKKEKKYLMNHPIPSKPRVIHKNMDLAVPEPSGPLNKRLDVLVVEDVADDSDSAVRLRGVDGPDDGVGFFFGSVSFPLFVWVIGERVPPSMSATTTFAPSFAKRRAASAPMPWPAPVMMATWPASRPRGKLRWEDNWERREDILDLVSLDGGRRPWCWSGYVELERA